MKKWTVLLVISMFFLQLLGGNTLAQVTQQQTQQLRDLQRLFLRMQTTTGRLYTEHETLKSQVLGVKISGQGKGYFLNSLFESDAEELREFNYGNIVDLGIGLRVTPGSYATAVMRLKNKEITTASILFDAADDFILKMGDFALQYTPLTLYEPGLDFLGTPYILRRQKWLGLAETQTGESRKLSGAMAEFMASDNAAVNLVWSITGTEDVPTATLSQQLLGGRLALAPTPRIALGFTIARIEDNAATPNASSIAKTPLFNQTIGGDLALELLPGVNFAAEIGVSSYKEDANSSFNPLTDNAYRAMVELPLGEFSLIGEYSYAGANYLALATYPTKTQELSLGKQSYNANQLYPLGAATPNRSGVALHGKYQLADFIIQATGRMASELQAANLEGLLQPAGALRSFVEAEFSTDGIIGPVNVNATYAKGFVKREGEASEELDLKLDKVALDLQMPLPKNCKLLLALMQDSEKGTETELRTSSLGYGLEYAFTKDASVYVQDLLTLTNRAGEEEKERTIGTEFRFQF